MRKVMNIIGKAVKIYAIADLSIWAIVGIGQYCKEGARRLESGEDMSGRAATAYMQEMFVDSVKGIVDLNKPFSDLFKLLLK